MPLQGFALAHVNMVVSTAAECNVISDSPTVAAQQYLQADLHKALAPGTLAAACQQPASALLSQGAQCSPAGSLLLQPAAAAAAAAGMYCLPLLLLSCCQSKGGRVCSNCDIFRCDPAAPAPAGAHQVFIENSSCMVSVTSASTAAASQRQQ